jgi:hypothetical protein
MSLFSYLSLALIESDVLLRDFSFFSTQERWICSDCKSTFVKGSCGRAVVKLQQMVLERRKCGRNQTSAVAAFEKWKTRENPEKRSNLILAYSSCDKNYYFHFSLH